MRQKRRCTKEGDRVTYIGREFSERTGQYSGDRHPVPLLLKNSAGKLILRKAQKAQLGGGLYIEFDSDGGGKIVAPIRLKLNPPSKAGSVVSSKK